MERLPARLPGPRLSEPPAAGILPASARQLLQTSPSWVVYDLEWTTWEGTLQRYWSGEGEELEVVQIGACRLDARDGLREVDHLSVLVRPALAPQLSSYFMKLTGITQQEVDADGVSFPEALRQLEAFAGPDCPLLSWGPFAVHDGPEPEVVVGDLYVLDRNARMHGLAPPAQECYTSNCRQGRGVDAKSLLVACGAEVQGLNSGRAYELGGEIAKAELEALGGGAGGRSAAHDALWDARSIGCALRACLRGAGPLAQLLSAGP